MQTKPLSSGAAPPLVVTGCSSLKLRQLSRRVSQQFDRVVGNSGLKTSQYSLLSQILNMGPVRPSDLAERMQMDASTLTRNLQPLVAHGWVATGPGEDRRSRLVSISDAGREKHAEARRDLRQAQLAFNAQLSDELVAKLHAVIDECLAQMHEEPS